MIMFAEKINGKEAYDIGLLDYIANDYDTLYFKM